MTVLLLNASYEPLSVISMPRAMSLLMREKVDAATDDVLTIRGAANDYELPRVLRLKRYISVPRRHARWSRKAVFQRDEFCCIYCGAEVGGQRHGKRLTQQDFSLDHILPRSRGGKNTWGNTACACNRCNNRKGNRLPHEAGMKLLWEPKIPRVSYWVVSGNVPQSWKIYLEV